VADTAGGLRFEVRVVEEALEEDLGHATEAGQAAMKAVVNELRSDGAAKEALKRCEDEARDGTKLGGCVKLYIPEPAGQWGAVFAADEEAAKPALVLLAVGERHPSKPWRPSVYQIAHRRLHRDEDDTVGVGEGGGG
jgi:hypothetical protein